MSEFAAAPGGQSGRSWLSHALHNKVIAVVLAMIVAVPLFAAPADYSLTGIAALTLETCSMLLLAMLVWRSKWDLSPKQLRTFAGTSANVPLMLFVGWVALSAAMSPAKVFSIQYLLQIGAGAILYFAVAYQFRQSKHLSLLADVLLFLAIVVSLGGLAQYQLNDEVRASALFGNAQPLGSFLMLMLPMVAALALGDKNSKRQTVAQIASVLIVGCLLVTQSRSAWLGSVAGLAVLALLSSRGIERMQAKASRRNAVAGGTVVPLKARKDQFVLPGLLAVIAVGFVFAMNSQNGDVAGRATTMSKLGSDASWMIRVQEHWHGAINMIAQHPVVGYGAGTFPVYQNAFTHVGMPISPDGTGIRVSLAEQAHNFYLQTAAELGLVGLGLMVAVLACFWVAAWNRVPQMEAGIRRTLLMASAAASVGFAVDALASPSWQYAQNSMFLWLILGVGTSCLRPRVRHEVEAVQFVAQSRRVSWVTRPAAVALFLLLSTLLPSAFNAAQARSYNRNNIFKYVFAGGIVIGFLDAFGVFHFSDGTVGTQPEGSTTQAPPTTTTQTVP